MAPSAPDQSVTEATPHELPAGVERLRGWVAHVPEKLLALAGFVADQTGRTPLRSELPLATRWSQARIDAIARAAKRWLDEVYADSGCWGSSGTMSTMSFSRDAGKP